MPWINRELIALCRGNPSQVTLILEDFPNLLMTHDITSPAFRERVSYWGRARTVHFVHELLNFARSPYDMIGYDRCVQYDPYYNNNVVVLSSSSSSSSGSGLSGSEGEDDVVRVVEPMPGTSGMANALGETGGRRGRTQFTIETRSSDQTVIMTGSFGGAGVSGIVSVSTSGTQTGSGPVAGASSSASFADLTRMHPLTSLAPQTSRLEDGENISLSSDDSDDCRIVGSLKPPHLRTPEMVSLESESDSDVVFVNEDNNRPEDPRPVDSAVILEQFLNAAAVTDSGLDQNGMAKLETGASASEYNNGASTSSGGSGCMKKFYAKPKLNRFANGIGFKSIYEASESEKSKEASVHSESDSSSHDEVKFNIRGHPPINTRKRKTTKRRSRASSTGSSDGCSDQSSTSDSTSSSSSLSSSMSSSSDDDSDDDFQSTKPPKKILKKRSKRSTLRKSSKRRSKTTKKRSKVKARKHSSTKRSRKRSKVAKSSSESGKGTSVSATSVPSVEAVPSGSNSNPSPKALPSCSKKRKLRSAIVKPTSTRHSSFKKRRKAPICSELISSTDSSDEDLPEPKQAPLVQSRQDAAAAVPSSASVSENNSSDSEGQCTIASLIRAVQQQTAADPDQQDKQNTSTSSSHSASTPNTSSLSSSHVDTSSSSPLCSSSLDRHQLLTAVREGGETLPVEEDVSVSQAIAVGAEVEL